MNRILSKLEPVFAAYRIQVAAVIVLVLFAGVAISAGQPRGSSRVTTSAPKPGEAGGDVATDTDPAAAAAAAAQAATSAKTKGRTPVIGPTINKGGIGITTVDGVPIANLFTAAEDKIGLADAGGALGKGTMTICGHGATSLGTAFNTSAESLDVYWKWRNANGGVHGRQLLTSWEDDAYDPTIAQQAAQRCKDKSPFMLLGGIGFDQIPGVREFAEQNHMFYLHHIARSDLSKKYSFGPLPTVQKTGTFAGEWVRKNYPNAKVGIIYRNSEYWIPGKDAFKEAFGKPNQIVAEKGVTKNQGSYHNELLELQRAGATFVFAWENALAQTAMIQEAHDQPFAGLGWKPDWIVFPFNLITDTVKDLALDPKIHGISVWPAYSPGDYSGPFAEYADEIKRFEAAYRQYDITAANAGLTDIHWMVWLAWRDLDRTFQACGRECSRNEVLGLMLTKPYGFDVTKPSCAVDFTRNGHEGGYWANIFEAYHKDINKDGQGDEDPNTGDPIVGWRGTQTCQTSFL